MVIKEEKQEQIRWEVKQVATQTDEVLYDNDNDKAHTLNQAITLVLNNQEKILKALSG